MRPHSGGNGAIRQSYGDPSFRWPIGANARHAGRFFGGSGETRGWTQFVSSPGLAQVLLSEDRSRLVSRRRSGQAAMARRSCGHWRGVRAIGKFVGSADLVAPFRLAGARDGGETERSVWWSRPPDAEASSAWPPD
jgi:hypothetical protein